ncbi:M1-specific T cell receptor beta chain [Syngnathoides biaculeatus]|uniref:M1-specific T cell receptor beta chain n=1 Tax=Syngnathoides biaculeatus TaxID=300417 RepID=UPI002ADD7BF3|nr:M1-specific T cell receptor beta chain [Syngnathoides biaculeatus]
MLLSLLSFAAAVGLLSGLKVTQTPADIIEKAGGSAAISCSHSIPNYDQILWYRHPGVGMQLIGYMYYKTPTLETQDQGVTLGGNAESGHTSKMTFPKLRLNSSSVYYCAASAHAAAGCRSLPDGSRAQIGATRRKPEDMTFLLLLSFAAGATPLSGLIVTQTPADIIASAGQSATLACSHQKSEYNQLLWYRQRGAGMELLGYITYKSATMEPGEDVKLEGGARIGETCRMTVPELHLNFSAVYYCAASAHGAVSEALFGGGTKLSVLEPNVEISFPTVTLFPPSDGECTNQKDREAKKKTLVCAATGFYPDHVEVAWLVNGQIRERGVAKDPEARRRGLQYAITSRLRVPAPEWLRGGAAFTCVVTFFDGTTYRNFTETISGKDDSSEDQLTRESFLRLTESAKLSYGVLIAKSCVYAVFVAFLLWRFRASSGKSS